MKKNNKHTGFTTPNDYFETFEEKLFSKLENTSPEKTGFKVPDNYFKNVEKSIIDKVNNEENTPIISLTNRNTLLIVASVAACLVLIFSVLKPTKSISINEIASSEIESYLSNHTTDFSENELLLLLNNEDITTLIDQTTSFNDQTLEEYLFDNLDNTTLLTE